jgi:hypothetical protein
MNESDPFIESLVLKVKTRQEVADEYGTTTRTLMRRLSKEGVMLPHGNIFPGSCKEIYHKLGIPPALKANHNGNHKK